ncbi:MAG: glycosyltransferase family 2 protein [Thermomicrobiales bacterium]|nr:glycosyltransferase family 2 protein [Thermomicrobiales bacterium]
MRGAWTAIIVNYNGATYLDACISALEGTDARPTEIVVVDNASTDDSLLELHAHPRVNVLSQPVNRGFAGGANAGLQIVETPYAVILNPDVEVAPTFGNALLRAFAEDARLGAAGALLTYPGTSTVQHAGGIVDRPLLTTRHRHYQDDLSAIDNETVAVDFVTGGAMALRMEAVCQIGGFDEQFSPVYYEDVDLCYELRRVGWGVRFVPSIRAEHYEGATLARSDDYYRYLHRSRILFALKHLSAREWQCSFLPAEVERIRQDIGSEGSNDWRAFSGADAVSVLLGLDDERTGMPPSSLAAVSPAAGQESLEEMRGLWEVQRRKPGESRFRRLLTPWNRQIDRALEQQRAFNGALVRAFEQQSEINRAQTANLLLVALELIARLRAASPQDSDSPSLQ